MSLLAKILLVFTLLSATTGTSSVEQDFNSAINANYDYYQVVISESTSVCDVIIVQGLIDDQLSISVFYHNMGLEDYWLKLSSSSKNKKLGSSSNYGAYYELKLAENEDYKITIYQHDSDVIFKEYNLNTGSLTAFESVALRGKAEHDFPRNSITPIYINWPAVVITVGVIACIAMIIAIVYLYKKRLGRFRLLYQNIANQMENQTSDYVDADYEMVENDVEMTTQERMDQLFERYRNGEINENQLNSELRKLWQEHDND